VNTPEKKRLDVARKAASASHPQNIFERRMSKFLREPPSVRLAANVIVTATVMIVLIGGVLMRVFDHKEYASIWQGMWLAIQTVTTVGYGDVTPKLVIGRIVAAVIMLWGVAFLAIITAAITSVFVARAQQERELVAQAEVSDAQSSVDDRLDKIDAQLERLSELLERTPPSS
jgi:voltage-gated potassium channel